MDETAQAPQDIAIDVTKWRNKVEAADTKLGTWREEAKKLIALYESMNNERSSTHVRNFNIFYANTETLRTAVYSAEPKPRVVPRFEKQDKLAVKTSEVLEKALDFEVDESDMNEVMQEAVNSALITGFGQVRVVYKPMMGTQMVVDPLTGAEQPQPMVAFQKLELELVDYDSVVFEICKKRKAIKWMAFKQYYTKDEMLEKFQLADGYNMKAYEPSGSKDAGGKSEMRVCVYQVWDKATRTVFFMADGYDQALLPEQDPYRLENFFPCPLPIQFMKRVGSNVPLPEYNAYKQLAEDLERISKRIAAITGFLKVAGVYDSGSTELSALLTADDGQMLASNMMSLGEKGGIGKVFELLPMEQIAAVLARLIETREQIKQTIYEVSGISDVMRGQSVASETATAQRIKGNFGTLRVQERQKEVARFARDLIAIMGELIANNYEPHVLEMMTGVKLEPQQMQPMTDPMTGVTQEPSVSWPEVMGVMRDDSVRAFTVDIETDSTISADEQEEQQQAVELVTAVTTYITGMAPLVQTGAVPMDVAKELLMVAVRRFKGVRAFEDALDKWAATPAMPPMLPQAPAPQPAPAIN
jgi:hypothetical protein